MPAELVNIQIKHSAEQKKQHCILSSDIKQVAIISKKKKKKNVLKFNKRQI